MRLETDVLIVGAGHGGAHAALALRKRKFAGTLTVVGDEPDLPYERPALSKEYLSGERGFERMLLRSAQFWSEQRIQLLLGRHVVCVDPARQLAMFRDDDPIHYGVLVWATGASPRNLTCPGRDLQGVHRIRSRGDIDRLQRELACAQRIVIVGGGYIGLEAAAVLRKLGKSVVLLEALDRVLSRVAGEQLSRFMESEHRARGVDVRLGASVVSVEGAAGRVTGVRIASGEVIPADLLIVGIGIEPNVGPLQAAHAVGENGVRIDEFCRTSLPDVYAIGDCALHANPYANGRILRLESVQNATDMGSTVAQAIVGEPEPYRALPWFWSNQYDLKVQTIGLSIDHDDAVLRGDMSSRSFSIIYRRAGRVIALDCVNAPKDYIQGRALVTAAARVEPGLLSDQTVPLSSLTTR